MALLFKIVESTEVYVKSRVGTLVYMAPEQFPKSLSKADLQKVQYKKTADIYSLALVLHQLFGAGANFYPDYMDTVMLSFAKSKGEVPQLNEARVPPRLRDVVRKGVATNPKTRPTLEEFCGAVSLARADDPDDMRSSAAKRTGSVGGTASQVAALSSGQDVCNSDDVQYLSHPFSSFSVDIQKSTDLIY